MKFLISAAGSHGDVLPFIAIGREMAARGHEVALFTNPYFRDEVTAAGLRLVPVGTLDEYHSVLQELAKANSRKAVRRAFAAFIEACRLYYQAMRAEIVASQTLAIGGSLLFAPHLLRETDGIARVTVHLAPSMFQSNVQPARLLPIWIKAETPMPLKKMAWWCCDKFFYEPFFTKPLNKLRGELGLPPVADIFRSWIHEADCLLAMFPEWFAPRQADWPAHAILAGFPLYDAGAPELPALPERLAEFIAAGSPPVAFSAGTANANAKDFFTTSIEACRLAGLRGIFLSHFAGQTPERLPAGIIHVDYAPFSALLPKLAAFVHHGGIGSTSQALCAGVPQLIRPVAFDQFDNSIRAVRLGVARELPPWRYSARAAADALASLTSDARARKRCEEIASRFAATSADSGAKNDAIQIACDAIMARCAA